MQDSDELFERRIGLLLRTGVLLSASLVATGGVWFLFRHASQPAGTGSFHAPAPGALAIHTIFWALLAGHSRSLMQLGLLVLIATPVARVVLSLFLFQRQNDYLYVAITGVVLVVLGVSMFI